RMGRVVWARESTTDMVTIYPQVSADGALLVEENSFWVVRDEGATSTVHRLRLDGSEEAGYPVPGLHHGFAEDGDGAMGWPGWGDDGETLERLSNDGAQERVWACALLEKNAAGAKPHCDANTVTWQPEADTFLLSLWSLDAVVEIDATTGANVRWFGELAGARTFDPTDARIWWHNGTTL